MKKKSVFPTEFFLSPEDYYNFAMKHKVFGMEAIKLKKEMMKQIIPVPKIKTIKSHEIVKL